MVTVKISEKGGQTSNYEFEKPEVTIGRMKGNDIVLPKGNVSKKHARLFSREGDLLIDDLDSTNGTYVNGRKVTEEHEVTENDKIYIGDFILQVQPERESGPPAAPPQPPGGESDQPRGGQPGGGPPSGGDSRPSPPDSGGGPPAGGASPGGGRPDQGDDPALDSLDEKYGGDAPGASGGNASRSSTRRDSAVDGRERQESGDVGGEPGPTPGSDFGSEPEPEPNRPGGGGSPGLDVESSPSAPATNDAPDRDRRSTTGESTPAGRSRDDDSGEDVGRQTARGTGPANRSGSGGLGGGRSDSGPGSGGTGGRSDAGPGSGGTSSRSDAGPGSGGTSSRSDAGPGSGGTSSRSDSGPGSSGTGSRPDSGPGGGEAGGRSDAKPDPTGGSRAPSDRGGEPARSDDRGRGSGRSGRRGGTDTSPPERSRRGERSRTDEGDRPEVGRDRSTDRSPARPPSEAELESEFDESFHRDLNDVADALLEQIRLDELPREFPPARGAREDFRSRVEEAFDKVSPRIDRELAVELLLDECVDLGPVSRYLDDDSVDSIYVNDFDRVLLRRGGSAVRAEYAFSHPELLQVVAERLFDGEHDGEISDTVRFADGTRAHVVMPPVTVDGPALTVQKPPSTHPRLSELVDEGVLSEEVQQFLDRAVASGQSLLLAGPSGSGRSTLLGALARAIPDTARFVAVEESSHLELPQQGAVRLEPQPAEGIEVEDVLESAISMEPERILLDECRGKEAFTWVSSSASGTEGSITTLHGISASDALGRLESFSMLGSGDVSPRGLREQIARAVDIVVVMNRTKGGGSRVQQVTEVQGVELDAFRLNDIFYFEGQGTSGGFHPTGYIPMFYEDLRHGGVDVDLEIFRE